MGAYCRAVTPRTRRLAAAGAVAVGVVIGVIFLTAVARHIRYASSDNANALLAGRAMVHGNPLLRGWDLPHDSYWLIDLPLFGLASLVLGFRELVLSFVPAAVDVALIVAGSVVAGLGLGPQWRRRWWASAAVMAILLGLPHFFLGAFILQGPHHVTTCLVCLVAFGLLAGAGLGGGRWLAATGLLAVAAHSDPIALAVGIVPIAAAGVVEGVRRRRLGALAVPVGAAAGALAGVFLIGLFVRLAGGYRSLPDPPAIGVWGENLRATPRILGGLLGASSPSGLAGWARGAHVVGASLFAAAIVVSAIRSLAGLVRRPARGPDGERPARFGPPGAAFLDDVLLIGCAGGVAVFAALTDPPLQTPNARYLLPTLILGAVLAARRTVEAAARVPVPVVAAIGVAFGAAYLTTPLASVNRPALTNPTVAVADWLRARGLQRGYGQYWVAGSTTVSGQGAVAVRPVLNDHGVLRPYMHFASRRWFGAGPFRFVVLDRTFPEAVDEPVAVRTFGPAAEAHDIGRYRVLIWNRDLALPASSTTG